MGYVENTLSHFIYRYSNNSMNIFEIEIQLLSYEIRLSERAFNCTCVVHQRIEIGYSAKHSMVVTFYVSYFLREKSVVVVLMEPSLSLVL